ncbi:DUF4279 domain-containing protein [Caballeronia sp. GAWG1-5s-s]|uniref:DUF4279 domain-containing protein n=1 Tax=Caballeronia sp. GAWG1-5s-s TaxID=2921743 RepID=UPI0020278E78|nr:DUF4279 domain-containing protein [Caballeronia sp. GAWG1-5s-s]
MNKSPRLAHASFIITGDRVVPDFWTSYFGVQPDIAVKKGDAIRRRRGTITAHRRTGVWSVSSESAVASDQLSPHLRYLKSSLGLPREDLRTLVEQAGAKMRFFCFWVNESGDRIPDVPADIQSMMDALGGTIEIDEYQ